MTAGSTSKEANVLQMSPKGFSWTFSVISWTFSVISEELPLIRTLTLQLKVTRNTMLKGYGELEISGVAHERQGAGTFGLEERSQLALWERRRVIEQRIDALLAEAHQLNLTADDILPMVRERKAAMVGTPNQQK